MQGLLSLLAELQHHDPMEDLIVALTLGLRGFNVRSLLSGALDRSRVDDV